MQELKPGQNFSHLFPPVHTCSHPFTPAHTFSHLLTPVRTSVTIYALRTMAASPWIFPLRKLLFFELTCYLFEIAYFCSPKWELSNGAWLEKLCRKKAIPLVAHTTVTMYVRRTVIFCTFECSYSSVLRRILLKLHILTHLIESFPIMYGLWSCTDAGLHLELLRFLHRWNS